MQTPTDLDPPMHVQHLTFIFVIGQTQLCPYEAFGKLYLFLVIICVVGENNATFP